MKAQQLFKCVCKVAVYEPIGDKLRKNRIARGLSLQEMAKICEISPSYLSKVETGAIKHVAKKIFKKCFEWLEYFDVDEDTCHDSKSERKWAKDNLQ